MTNGEPQFGIDDCTCIPFTRQTNPPRYLNRPTDTVDMISGWERGRDCPHHAPAVPVSSPPPDQTALRDRIAEAVRETVTRIADLRSFDTQIAAAVLAVLPTPADRTTVLLEAADELGRMDYDTDSNDYGYDTYRDAWNGGVMDGADKLRRLAAEAQQPDTETRP